VTETLAYTGEKALHISGTDNRRFRAHR
jgi:hypothetical protein